jgi:UDP-glucose:glycoprotein glucosyltransferase
MVVSSAVGDSISTIMDKVYSLAAETALPVDDYRAWLTSFSADTVLKGIDKVSI